MTTPAPITPGDIRLTWCSVCGHATPHVWGGWPPMKCLVCHPEVGNNPASTEKKESEK